MTIQGDSDFWNDTFPEELIPDILGLVFEAWKTFPKLARDAHEVPTTRDFRCFMIRTKNLRRLPFRIEREVPEDDFDRATEMGRIDLKLAPVGSAREEVYFAFECKRLNALSGGRTRSLASEYVCEGMMRFVTGQYASSQNHGGIIGYVLDGSVTRAIANVQRSILTHQTDLRIPEPSGLDRSSIHPSQSALRETRHRLPDRTLSLHHVFLAS